MDIKDGNVYVNITNYSINIYIIKENPDYPHSSNNKYILIEFCGLFGINEACGYWNVLLFTSERTVEDHLSKDCFLLKNKSSLEEAMFNVVLEKLWK